MSADNIGTIGQAVRMPLIGGAEQQSRRVDRAARRDHDICRNFFANAMALDYYLADLAARRAGLEPFDVSPGSESYVGMLERRIDGADLSVGLGTNQARKSVTAIA